MRRAWGVLAGAIGYLVLLAMAWGYLILLDTFLTL